MFSNIFETPKRNYETYLFTDGMEMYCLYNKNKSIQKSEYEQILRIGEDFNPEIKKEDVDNDSYSIFCNDIFKDVNMRIRTFEDDYPFIYNTEEEYFKLKDDIGNGGRLYLVLLFASNLAKLNKNHNLFTSALEIIGLKVIQNLFPNAQVRLFGSSNINKELVEHFANNKLNEKMIELSRFINQPVLSLENIRDNNTGDNGLDIIAKIPVSDSLSSNPLIFVQCASSNEEWSTKQHEISRSRWASYLDINDTSFLNFVFIPHAYRNLENLWFDRHKIIQSVLFDRYRICKNIEDFDILNRTKAFQFIDQYLKDE